MHTHPPSRQDVEQKLLGLLKGNVSREDVADWAAQWVRLECPGIEDRAVWSGLKHLAGADLKESPQSYLHHDIDFHAWLDELQSSAP